MLLESKSSPKSAQFEAELLSNELTQPRKYYPTKESKDISRKFPARRTFIDQKIRNNLHAKLMLYRRNQRRINSNREL